MEPIWVKNRKVEAGCRQGEPVVAAGRDPPPYMAGKPALAGPGLRTRDPAARVDVLAGLDGHDRSDLT